MLSITTIDDQRHEFHFYDQDYEPRHMGAQHQPQRRLNLLSLRRLSTLYELEEISGCWKVILTLFVPRNLCAFSKRGGLRSFT